MKNTFSKLLLVLTVLALAVCLCAVTVSAEADSERFSSNTWVHPYEEALPAEEETNVTISAATGARNYPIPSYYCTSFTEFHNAMRTQFAARNTYFILGLRSSTEIAWSTVWNEVNSNSFKHTGNPKEGDYIYWNIRQYSNEGERVYVNGYYDYTIVFECSYRSTAYQEQQVDAAVTNLLTYLNLDGYSDYAKVRRVYDYMISNITYDYEGLDNDGTGICHTTYSAIVLKNTVCQGYASLFYRLMLELGVECRALGGDANNYGETGPDYPSGVGDNHCWNIVKLDGKWYNLDSTWDANNYEAGYGMTHDWFLVSNANFPRHYPWSDAKHYPASFWAEHPISTTNYNCTTSPNGWYQKNGTWRYGQNGFDRAGWLKDGQSWYYLDNNGNLKTGWLQDGTNWYYLQPGTGGTMATGIITISGKSHQFTSSGVWQGEVNTNGWIQQNGVWYYYKNGAKATGWQSIGGKWYYFASNGAMVKGWLQQGSKWYYFHSDGSMATGTITIGGKQNKFDANGVWQGEVQTQQNGWVQQSGVWYYYKNGAKATGWQKIGNLWYFFNSNGSMKTGWLQQGSKWYYFKNDGSMATGIITISGKQNKFDANGVWLGEVQTQQNGWVQQSGVWYYYKNGTKATGWQKISNVWYYFNSNGSMKTGWLSSGGEWYYFGSDGAMKTSWQEIGGKFYYFDEEGIMFRDTWGRDPEGNIYYFTQDGYIYQNGWYWIDGEQYYFDEDGYCLNY